MSCSTADTTPAAIEALLSGAEWQEPENLRRYLFPTFSALSAELATARAERDEAQGRVEFLNELDRTNNAKIEDLQGQVDAAYNSTAALRKEVERLKADRPFIVGANHGYETAMDQLRETLQEQSAALVEAKREMWVGARSQWTLADFKNWAVIQQIDAALTKGRAALARMKEATK